MMTMAAANAIELLAEYGLGGSPVVGLLESTTTTTMMTMAAAPAIAAQVLAGPHSFVETMNVGIAVMAPKIVTETSFVAAAAVAEMTEEALHLLESMRCTSRCPAQPSFTGLCAGPVRRCTD